MKSAVVGDADGLAVKIIASGAALAELWVPVGKRRINVVLGYSSADDYLHDSYYMGSTVGRYANRIAGAAATIAGQPYRFDANQQPGGHCLHGGNDGLHRQRWRLQVDKVETSVRCHLLSEHGAAGFPGNLEIEVTYRLLRGNTLQIDFHATSDSDTVLSLTDHAYFNLSGEATIDEHELMLRADSFTPVDAENIPTGCVEPVQGTPFDWRRMQRLNGRELDQNFVLHNDEQFAAILQSRRGGLAMGVKTTQPGLQVYTADALGAPFAARQGICLETQSYPDAPNQPHFPSSLLRAGEHYRHCTSFTFQSLND